MKQYGFLILFLIVYLFSCTNKINRKIGSCYLHENDKIKYLQKNETGKIDTLVLKDANAVFFELIHDEMPGDVCVNGHIWAKDKLNVWYKNKMLPGADPKTFTVLENGYSLDKEHVYYYDNIIVSADIESFEVLSYFFAKDKDMILFQGKEVFGVKYINSFRVIDAYFSKDSATVYFNNDTLLNKLPDSDPKTFQYHTSIESQELTSLKYYTDKDKVYLVDTDKKVGEEDFLYMFEAFTESFSVYREKYYSGDNFNVYFKNKIIENADLETFETLGNEYARDKDFIYYQYKRLLGADKESFKVFAEDEGFDARDKSNYFLKGKKVRE